VTITYPVADLEASVRLFAGLFGVEPYMHQPSYAAFKVGGADVGLDPGQAGGAGTPVPYWRVEEMTAAIDRLASAGCTIEQAATPVGGGRSIARLRDQNGVIIGLVHDERPA
jgi:predicted enzyme related to lactoylglutathione lyase